VQLKQVIIAHKAEFPESSLGRNLCAATGKSQLSHHGAEWAKDNPTLGFLASAIQPIDLALVLGGDGTVLTAARAFSGRWYPTGGECRWTPGVLTESLKNSKTLSKLERLSSDRYPAADDATGKSFEGDGRGASFASRKNREIEAIAPAAALPER